MVVTSWGEKDETEYIINLFQDQLKVDESAEVTTLASRIDTISPRANQLRMAAILANEYLFREANRGEYICAAEFLAVVYDKGVLSWVQVGSPHLILLASGQIQPLAYQLDYSWQYGQDSPLFSQALGLNASCLLSCGSLHVNSEMDLFLISRHSIPPALFAEKRLDFQSLIGLLVKDSANAPFWVGHLKV
jgi:hypothetical protein